MGFRLGHTRAWLLAGAIFILNVIVRAWYLGTQDIALDEPFTIFHAQQSLAELFELFPRENNPPIHFLLTHFQIKLFGLGPESVRFPSLLFSSLTAVVMFRLAYRHWGLFAALVSSLIFSLSTFHIYFAHETRVFSLLTLLAVLALDRMLRMLDEPGRWSHYVWLGLWTVLAMYSHFLGFWLLVAQGIAFWWLPNKAQLWKRFLAMYLAIGLLYLPFAWTFLTRLGAYGDGGNWLWRPQWTELYGNVNRFLNDRWVTVMVALPVAAGVFGLVVQGKWKERAGEMLKDRSLWMVMSWWLVIYMGMFVVSFMGAAMFLDRYLLFTTPALFLLIGRLWDGVLQEKWMQLVALGMLILALGITVDLNPSNQREPGAMAEMVRAGSDERTAVVIAPKYYDKNFMYHFERAAFEQPNEMKAWMAEHEIYPMNSAKGLVKIDQNRIRKVYFVDADAQFTLPENGIVTALSQQFTHQSQQEFAGKFKVWKFEDWSGEKLDRSD